MINSELIARLKELPPCAQVHFDYDGVEHDVEEAWLEPEGDILLSGMSYTPQTPTPVYPHKLWSDI